MRRVPRSTVLALPALLLVAAAGSGQESSLTNHALPSELVPGEPRFDLLLPPAYNPERAEPYPLLLWLHGGGNGAGQLQRRRGRYAPRVPNQLNYETVDFSSPPP